MLSLGSASVWNTPAVLNLYMGYRQTPDASQKRTVPSSCLHTQINRILLICYRNVPIQISKVEINWPCEQQVSLWRVWGQVLASCDWPRLYEAEKLKFNNNNNLVAFWSTRNDLICPYSGWSIPYMMSTFRVQVDSLKSHTGLYLATFVSQ